MKKAFTTLLFCTIFSLLFAQEKGDNYLGLNFGISKNTTEFINTTTKSKYNYFGLSYSRFLKENRRLTISPTYFNSKSEYNQNGFISNNTINGYGVGLVYGVLFPLLKNFYAELSPGINYSFSKLESDPVINNLNNSNNSYTFNLTGGLIWVPFKHLGMNINLASVGFGYSKQKDQSISNGNLATSTSNSFGINNQGSLQNQSFTIFYKFK